MISFRMLFVAPVFWFGIHATGFAQVFGQYGTTAPTTPAQQQAIDQASAFLTSVGENLTGITISNADLTGSIPASTSADGTRIGIDFERLEAVVPPETPGAPGHPGCVVILIFHELQHRNHGWGHGICNEVMLACSVAVKHCDFIAWILDGGGGAVNALCLMYAHVRDKANGAETQAKQDRAGCSNDCTIPPCAVCPQ